MLLLFATTLFLSAILLFGIQPMLAKMVLPVLGGTPLVWNTCVVFFQVMLLAGYSYAHATTVWLGVRRQAVLHIGVLLLPLIALPIGLPKGWAPPVQNNPAPWLMLLLLVSVGSPFFVVSASAPMLQKWFASTDHPSAKDPYFLYAASNLGSILALLSYPLLVEPSLRLGDQRSFWTVGYVLLVVLTLSCAVMVWRSHGVTSQNPKVFDRARYASPPWDQRNSVTFVGRARWVALSFVPSSMMLGLTTYITSDIISIPLLWVIPLAIYLLTFVLVFARRPPVSHTLVVEAFPVVLLFLVSFIAFRSARPFWVLIPLHLITFFLVAIGCHGELARSRPAAKHLTEFYLWLSVGGALGGLFNALVAPAVFTVALEYPLTMVLACLLWPRTGRVKRERFGRLLDLTLPLALGVAVIGIAWILESAGVRITINVLYLIFIPALILCYSFSDRPVRFGLGIAAILVGSMLFKGGVARGLHTERSFFGVYRVVLDPEEKYCQLIHGNTIHGVQSLDPSRRCEPLSYFYRTGPIGQIFSAFSGKQAKQQVAIIGLGAGSMACYGESGQEFTFYEIDPVVERIARDSRYFTFLQDCTPEINVILGDARLSLRAAPDGRYGLITLDAFSSDAIPQHLLTREAIELYLSKLASDGLLAFHISNRYLDLRPVLGDLAQSMELVCIAQDDLSISDDEGLKGKAPSQWVLMARQYPDLGKLADDKRWTELRGRVGARVWTDDFSNILGILKWN